jgi:hypothetical protein
MSFDLANIREMDFLPLLYPKSWTSQHRHFSPEDANSMFLRNKGVTTQNIVILTAMRTSNLTVSVIHGSVVNLNIPVGRCNL